MATIKQEEEKRNFPMLPVSQWWKLRNLFKKSIPGVVSDSYLVSTLNIKQGSAQTNIIPALKLFKLIDDNGKTTEIVKDWRDDLKYPDVCKRLREAIYPKELFDACPDPLNDRESVKRWFAHITGTGDTAVLKMVAIFLVLVEANPDGKQIQVGKQKVAEKKEKPIKPVKKMDKKESNSESRPVVDSNHIDKHWPEVCINLQIHISPDATSDQIEKIFESIGKHLYGNK